MPDDALLRQVAGALRHVLTCRDCNRTGVLPAPPPRRSATAVAITEGDVLRPPRDEDWPRRPQAQLVQCLCRTQAMDALAAAGVHL